MSATAADHAEKVDTSSPWARFTTSQQRSNPDFEPRLQQDQLAATITTNIDAGDHLVAEAPTGVGKSYAALVPTINRARRTGKPVVIATPSKPLQVQYAHKDIRVVEEHTGPVKSALLFGRNNYTCLAKLDNPKNIPSWRLDNITSSLPDDGELVTGIPDNLNLTTQERAEITTTSDECPGARSCAFGKTCHYEIAKTEAHQADVIVTNTTMLIASAKIGPGVVLPEWSTLVIDEAHKLPDITVEALGWNLTSQGSQRLTRTVRTVLADEYEAERYDPIVLDDITGTVEKIIETLRPSTVGQPRRRLRTGDITKVVTILNVLEISLDTIDSDLAQSQWHAQRTLDEILEPDGKDRESTADEEEIRTAQKILDNLSAARRQVTNYLERCNNMREYCDENAVVMWSETTSHRGKLCYRPLDIAPFLTEKVWSQAPAVLMSATIPTGFSVAVGLPDVTQLTVNSPFRHDKQSCRYVAIHITPRTKPKDPGKTRWLDQLGNEIIDLVLAAGGRSLVLFASYNDLEATRQRTQEPINRAGITLLTQNNGVNRQRLIHQFKTDETSVLFGVASFEEGIDVPGDALKLVIITRLPNATLDDPLFVKRVELAGGGYPGYAAVNGPLVAVRIAQAAGRLIRTRTDTGMVAILDGRVSRGDGRTALTKLPPVTTLTTLVHATTVLTALKPGHSGTHSDFNGAA